MNIGQVNPVVNLAQSSQQMGDMLKQMTTANMGMEEKMMKLTVVAGLTGVGQNLDVTG